MSCCRDKLSGRCGFDQTTQIHHRQKTRTEIVDHALLERLYSDAVRLVQDPSGDAFDEAKATFESLERVVRSHFGYEEEELEEALGVYGGL